MSYEAIDERIQQWAERNALKLFTSWGHRPVRVAYESTEAGECFQMSIAPPSDGVVCISAQCVEGRTDLHPSEDWIYPVEAVSEGLSEAFQTVTAWMRPSVRYFPPSEER